MRIGSSVDITFRNFRVDVLVLAQLTGQIDLLHPTWLWLTAFVGLNLFQMGFTGYCPPAKVFKALGFKEATNACSTTASSKSCR
ncbi:hypothetical protein THIX_30590 [Thiomonas sp. X19]|nr:hypothetical protein THIX_30590 [Thiomonas sp. X19]